MLVTGFWLLVAECIAHGAWGIASCSLYALRYALFDLPTAPHRSLDSEEVNSVF